VTCKHENGEVGKGNPDEFFGGTLLAFLDILGFSQHVRSNWGQHSESALCKLLRIKEEIPQADRQVVFAVYSKDDLSDRITYKCRIQTVSDSIMISAAVGSSCMPLEFVAAFAAVFVNIKQIWRQVILEGFTLRGCIEIGGAYWSGNDITGPVVVSACDIEKNTASWSRVLVGPCLINHLLKVSKVINIENDTFGVLSLLNKDADGLISVSPKTLVDLVGRLEVAQQSSNTRKVRRKYDELLQLLREPGRMAVPTIEELKAALPRLSGSHTTPPHAQP